MKKQKPNNPPVSLNGTAFFKGTEPTSPIRKLISRFDKEFQKNVAGYQTPESLIQELELNQAYWNYPEETKTLVIVKPNNSTDWESRFTEAYEENGWFIASDDQKPIIDFISSELQRERERMLKEVEGIIEKSSADLVCHTQTPPFREDYIIKSELLSKLNSLKEKESK